jgi:NAD(P)-dependent dehydrogenase (short-subunit alcohol dehydrogenase family)
MSDGAGALAGRVAAVTGAGGGLGRGIALALGAAGARLLLLGRTPETLEETAREVRALGARASWAACDVRDAAAVREALGSAPELDVLVNNAGTNVPGPFLEVEESALTAVLDLNLKAAFLVAQAAARIMVRRGEGGAIVNVSSQMGHVGARNRTVYCASKHGLEGLTKAMALDLAGERIRVNSVAPTFVETPMTRPFLADAGFRANTLARIPLGTLAEVGDVAAAVVYLASPAARMVTGTSLRVDGGWTAQ